jgi:YbbR domain-containing protein
MDIDGPESGTQTMYQPKDYGVVVDFEELGEDEQEVRFRIFAPSLLVVL